MQQCGIQIVVTLGQCSGGQVLPSSKTLRQYLWHKLASFAYKLVTDLLKVISLLLPSNTLVICVYPCKAFTFDLGQWVYIVEYIHSHMPFIFMGKILTRFQRSSYKLEGYSEESISMDD